MNNEKTAFQGASKVYSLPCLFTASNLFSGFLFIIQSIQTRYCLVSEAMSTVYCAQAVWSVFLSGICDSLDGRIARLGRKESLFGKEFDSMADVISFEVAPALMVFLMILSPTEQFPFLDRLDGFSDLYIYYVRVYGWRGLMWQQILCSQKPNRRKTIMIF
jgi:CDP-diacylglycerol--serine O-phosphatidyltransferase